MASLPKEIYLDSEDKGRFYLSEKEAMQGAKDDGDTDVKIGKYVLVSIKEYEWRFVEKPKAKAKKSKK